MGTFFGVVWAVLSIFAIMAGFALVMWGLFRFIDFSQGWQDRRFAGQALAASRKRCPVCQQGGGVLLNEDSYGTGYWPTNNWCEEHKERLKRIRSLEHEVLGVERPDPLASLIKRIYEKGD